MRLLRRGEMFRAAPGMIVFFNGRFIREEEAVVSIFDRCFRYGDGLFEAVLAVNGRLFRWREHFERLRASAETLRFKLTFTSEQLETACLDLLARNQTPHAVVRIGLSRGVGPRGYAPDGSEEPLLVITTHPAPDARELQQWKLCTAPFRVAANDPLAHHKTCSRLLNVLAATHAREHGADEAIFVDTDGCVTEGGSSNLFWIENGTVCSAPLSASVLPGVTRRIVFELCDALGVPRSERRLARDKLPQAEGVFVSLTSRGIVEAVSLDELPLSRSPVVPMLQRAFQEKLAAECGAP